MQYVLLIQLCLQCLHFIKRCLYLCLEVRYLLCLVRCRRIRLRRLLHRSLLAHQLMNAAHRAWPEEAGASGEIDGGEYRRFVRILEKNECYMGLLAEVGGLVAW